MMLCAIKIFMFLASLNLMEATECHYNRLNNRARDEGHFLGKYPNKSEKECEDICDSVSSCQSFGYATSIDRVNPNTCWLYDKVITACEPQIVWFGVYTVYKVCDTCDKKLVSGCDYNIPDKSITASSKYSYLYRPENARLNTKGSWISKSFDKDPWIQGTFDKQLKVTAIQTQGRHDYWNWVKSYKISYSENGADWKVYKSEDGSEQVFQGNTDHTTVVTNTLHTPILNIKYIRILPQTWKGHLSLRFEILGCATKGVSYRTPLKNGGCAVSMAKFHERCHCANDDKNICKYYCDADDNCKGYAGSLSMEPYCHFSTTSQCPAGCSKYDTGEVGKLLFDAELYQDVYSGCYIKNT